MKKSLTLAGGALVVFAVVAAIMIKLMPSPLKDSDYLVVGSVSTLMALLTVFLGLISTTLKTGDVFYKKRPKKK